MNTPADQDWKLPGKFDDIQHTFTLLITPKEFENLSKYIIILFSK